MGRYSIVEAISRLDPVKDHQRIAYLTGCYEFPWDTTRSLELAMFRTFAVSKGTRLLASTGEFIQRTQKRYDDTVLIMSEILEHGYDSQRGRAALRRMNQMHGRYAIPNDEFLYVLSTFLFEPIRWNARFGWRPLLEVEKEAAFQYWRQIGRLMNIKDIPATYEEFERFNVEYEEAHFGYAVENEQLATVTRDLYLSWYLPRWMWRFGAPFLYAIMDDSLLKAVGFPAPPTFVRRLVEGGLRLRAQILRRLPPRRKPRLITQQQHPTYPHGYRIEELGTR